MKSNGRIALLLGSLETGTGFFSVMQQMAAQHFRMPVDHVEVAQGDTLATGFEVGPSGSRLTGTASQALEAAVAKASDILKGLASERLPV